MPELPEVETVRRGLEPVLVGRRLIRVEQRRANLRFPFPDRFPQRLEGTTISSLHRRAKYILAHLSSGEVLAIHLGMSGRFTIELPEAIVDRGLATRLKPRKGQYVTSRVVSGVAGFSKSDPKHDHVVFATDTGAIVTYNDPRRFGYMTLIADDELDQHKLFRSLGPEPLGNELSAAYLAQMAQGRKTDLKAFLMDQKNIAGLGNIYVCEILHRAGLSPDRAAASLATKTGKPLRRCNDLITAIRTVLQEAIEAGGSSLRDYRQTDGALGYFQHAFRVYGRQNEPCRSQVCQNKAEPAQIMRKVHAGRSTFYCHCCQK